MRVLLLGATGLIGSAVAARLLRDGHELVGVARRIDAAARRVPVAEWHELDLRGMLRPEDWRPHLAGVAAVVNCAGALQEGPRDALDRVHRDAPIALWRACAEAGVRRIVQVSALGVDRCALTAFSRSKSEGDAALAASDLDWIVLRPSVVVGAPAYGGSALLRGLATLPVLPRIPDAGPIDVVQLDDVAETVAWVLAPGAPSRIALELAGPERLGFGEIVAAYRRWFGWRPAREIRVPALLLGLGWRLGDLVARLGWRPPLRGTARRELVRGATGDHREWTRLTGIVPQPLGQALASRPATVQERWFARLFLLKPLALGAFALFWLVTGLISLGPGWDEAVAMMRATPAARWAGLAVAAGALLDLVIGAAMIFRPTARAALLAALAASLLYLLLGTVLAPSLWADPLGPLLKVVPILLFNLLCLALVDER